MNSPVTNDQKLTWKREERDGRSYWHIYDKAGNRVRPIIGIEGYLIEEIERLRDVLGEITTMDGDQARHEAECALRPEPVTALDQVR